MAPKTNPKSALELKTIGSTAKETTPPNAVQMVMVDLLNSRTLEKRFEEVKSSNEDDFVEKLAHTMAICTRLHNQCVMEALLPLVKQLKKGGTLSKSMSSKVVKIEEMLEKLDATKKHLNNEEFVNMMEEKKKMCEEQFTEEEEVLKLMLDELDEESLINGAELMESVKVKASLAPQHKVYA